MLWDPPVRLLDLLLGVDQLAAATAIILCALGLTFFAGTPLRPAPPLDPLLAMPPLLNGAFFASNALVGRGAAQLPGTLRLFVLTVATIASVAYARAAGLLSSTEAQAAPSKGK